MVDLFLKALTAKKQKSKFDPNYALICANLSKQAYSTPEDQKTFLAKYGFTEITSFVQDASEAFACCYGGDLYIAIAGTNFTSIKDIMNDIDIGWKREGVGEVHDGYQDHLNLIWSNIKTHINNTPNKQVIITGHSLGGGVGQIVNYRLPASMGYFFGSTRAVDADIQQYNKSLVYQIIHRYDIVPQLPLAIMGYRLLGNVFVIENDTVTVKLPSWHDTLYSIVSTLLYYGMMVYTKSFTNKSKLDNRVLSSHTIVSYISDLERLV